MIVNALKPSISISGIFAPKRFAPLINKLIPAATTL
jgi:hypothetical protein